MTTAPRQTGVCRRDLPYLDHRRRHRNRRQERNRRLAEVKKREVTLVDSSHQPSRAELEEVNTFPEGMTPDDLARAVMQPVDIMWTPRPE